MVDMAEKDVDKDSENHPEPGPTGKGHGDTPSPDGASKAGAVAISPDDTTDATGEESASSPVMHRNEDIMVEMGINELLLPKVRCHQVM